MNKSLSKSLSVELKDHPISLRSSKKMSEIQETRLNTEEDLGHFLEMLVDLGLYRFFDWVVYA